MLTFFEKSSSSSSSSSTRKSMLLWSVWEVAFVLVTLLMFYLQSQGWSPQWLVEILPLTLLCFPNQRGVLICVVLTLLTFAEYPALFIRTGDTGGEIAGALLLPFTVLIITRTVILAGLVVALYRQLSQKTA
jgi:hypothetical protein